jgi:hypothetical protein
LRGTKGGDSGRAMQTRDASVLRWGRCLLGGLATFGTSLFLTAAIVTVHAFRLAFEARGQPDRLEIQAFARQVGPVWGPVLLVVLTLVAGAWVARRVGAPAIHGLIVGAVAAIGGLLAAWPLGLRDGAVSAAVVAAGWLGGALAGRSARMSQEAT